jgi:predicted GIY-YIG superfamily endonuclease
MIENTNEHSVYWIHMSHEKDIFSEGYIGTSNCIKRRWHRHKINAEVKLTKKNKMPLYQSFRQQ